MGNIHLIKNETMPGKPKKITTCAHCRHRKRQRPSIYCHKHRNVGTSEVAGGNDGEETLIDSVTQGEPAIQGVIRQEEMEDAAESTSGDLLLENDLSQFNFDPALCAGLTLSERNIDVTGGGRRILQPVPTAIVRKLVPIVQEMLQCHFKHHGTFKVDKRAISYITGYTRSRNRHVNQNVHRDVDLGSPPGYLSIFMFLDSTDDGSGGIEIWEDSTKIVLGVRNTTRDLRKCTSVKFQPKKGTMVVFDGRLAHRGLAHTSHHVRVGVHVYAWPINKGLAPLNVMN